MMFQPTFSGFRQQPEFLPGPLPTLPPPIAIWEAKNAQYNVMNVISVVPVSAGYTENFLRMDSVTPLALRPRFVSGGGHSGVDAIDHYEARCRLIVPSFKIPEGCRDITIISVIKRTNPTGADTLLTLSGAEVDIKLLRGNVSFLQVEITSEGVSTYPRKINIGLEGDKWMRAGAAAYLSDPVPQGAAYKNGVMGTNSSGTFLHTKPLPQGGVFSLGWLGGPEGTGNFGFQGLISETHVYPKLTAAQFTVLDNYIESKYSTPFPA